jgi:hypothetical protein
VFHAVNNFHCVDLPQDADRQTVLGMVGIGRRHLGILPKLWHRRGQRQSKEYRTAGKPFAFAPDFLHSQNPHAKILLR